MHRGNALPSEDLHLSERPSYLVGGRERKGKQMAQSRSLLASAFPSPSRIDVTENLSHVRDPWSPLSHMVANLIFPPQRPEPLTPARPELSSAPRHAFRCDRGKPVAQVYSRYFR